MEKIQKCGKKPTDDKKATFYSEVMISIQKLYSNVLILIQSTMVSLLRSEKMEELLEKQRKLFLAVCIRRISILFI
jgi:hypothetical protein